MVRFQSCSVNLFYFFLRRDGESAFRCGAELGVSRALLSEACERDESWRACLPVLELRLRGVYFGRGVCWDWRVPISLLRKGLRNGVLLKNG